MPNVAGPGVARINAYVARVICSFSENSADLIARLACDHKDEVSLSPQLAGWLTGLSAPTLRQTMPTRGRGRHRHVTLAELERMGVAVTAETLAAAFRRAILDATPRQYLADGAMTELRPWGKPIPATPEARLLEHLNATQKAGSPVRIAP